MTYSTVTFVAFEQPTAAKMNLLGENDAGFRDGTNISDDVILARHIDWASTGANGGIWWEELGRTTLGVAGDTITLSSLSARKYLQILVATIATGGAVTTGFRFNNDSGTNYARRLGTNNSAEATNASQTSLLVGSGSLGNRLVTAEVLNIANQEKVLKVHDLQSNAAGAGNVPTHDESFNKWANTTDQITRVDVLNGGAGDFASGSEVVVLGHN